MRKGTIFVTALLAATGAALAVPAASAPGLGASSALGTQTVPLPSRAITIAYDRSVARVQRALNDLGYSAGPVDGIMGSSTRSAIRSYQHDNGMVIDGQVSRELVRALRGDRREERRADAGVASSADASTQLVIDVQTELRRAGYAVPEVDGKLDAETQAAIRTYQADHGLLTTGQPTEQLVAHIRQNADTVRSSGEMSRHDLVQATQKELNDLGYSAGPPDGIMGSKTRSAIRTYQADAGLAVTGDVSSDLLAKIRSSETASRSDRDGTRHRVTQLTDSFSDGQFTSSPRWQVLAGSFNVSGGALHSTVRQPKASDSDDVEEVARNVLQGVVSRALGVQIGQRDDLAAIATPVALSNSFRFQAKVGGNGGAMSFGPYQGTDASTGYRVELRPGRQPAARILALGADNDTRVVATSADRITLPGGGTHAIDWRREDNGSMSLIIDGHTVIQTSDMGFSNAFSGIVLVNGGGTWTVDDVRVDSPAG